MLERRANRGLQVATRHVRMRTKSRDLGKAVDALLRDERRLVIAHVLLASISTVAYWLRPSTPHPAPAGARGYAVMVALLTWRGWAPYCVSWVWARQLLVGTGRGTLAFIAMATVICAASAALYLGLFGALGALPPTTIALGVTLLLLGGAFVCAIVL